MDELNTLDRPIDKVYIDGPCDSKTLAGVFFLVNIERVSHVTHFYK